ncbi:MAG: helix-turn-helix domain-containing protein [Paracoccaceae bacterium]|nr:helix-turn-helix domain-containing protein [Paracoccaceae bacterium]
MYITLDHPGCDAILPQPSSKYTRKINELTLEPDTNLFRQGDPASQVFQVKSGALRLSRYFEDGRRQVISFSFPGDVIGYPFEGEYSASCRALTPCRLQPYRMQQLISPDGEDPALHAGFVKAAMREIAAMHDHFVLLGQKSAVERLAAFLTALASRIGEPVGQYTQFKLPMCRADIADYLGLSTETVSRAFSQLRREKVIALDGILTVVILDLDTLHRMAEAA